MDFLNSSAKSLFVLYLMISSNYLGTLFGCKVQDAFNTNMAIKHLLGFLTLYFFVSLVDTTKYSPILKLLFSAIIYLCFMVSTKMNHKMWIAFISLLGIIYVLFIFKDSITDSKTKDMISYFQLVLVILCIILLMVGFIYYLGEKKIEYGNEFSYSKFLLGTQTCKLSTPKINESFTEIIKIGMKPTKYIK
jgi:hypothetical protein